MWRTLASAGRLARAGVALARRDALLPKEYQDALPPGARLIGRILRLFADPRRDAAPGVRLAEALQSLGPAYVKLGQFLATRSDVVGVEVAQGLSSLKDKMAAVPIEAARATIETELGAPLASAFTSFEPALAAASVAQVHRATTLEGSAAAVKVLRPGVEAALAKDVAAFRLAAHVIEALSPSSRRLKPKALVETLARSLRLETDLRLEAAAAGEMDELAANLPGFVVPAVNWSRTTKRMMTLEWIDGVALSDDAALNSAQVDKPALAIAVIRTFLASALDHGVFHADMHEGNLFALPDGRLAAVDFGIMGRIGRDERRYLAEILYGFLKRDYARIARVHFEAGYVPASQSVDDFAAALRAVGEPIFGRRSSEMSMARVLLQLFEVTELFDMALRPELVLLQKTMVQAEGVARKLDPDFDMWAAAQPIVERWIRRELGPEGRVRDAAADLERLAASVRRLPSTLEALEAGAQRLAAEGSPPTAAANSNAAWMLAAGTWALVFALVWIGWRLG